jgi:hypothetical protein
LSRSAGEPILRREVWRGEPKVGWAGIVVEDGPELLALYMPGGSPLAYADDFFGEPHPWSGRDRWEGHGVLQLHRPGEMHAVWVFWHGPEREFRGWYVNLQEPFRRTARGFDTQDLELDIVVDRDGGWRFKDDALLEHWIERGRWREEEVSAIRREGAAIAAELESDRRWWGDEWAAWEPDPAWEIPELPDDWAARG